MTICSRRHWCLRLMASSQRAMRIYILLKREFCSVENCKCVLRLYAAGLCRCQHLYKPGDLEQRIRECAGPGVGQHQKRRVAQLPCGDIMTIMIKVCFILPQTQAKI